MLEAALDELCKAKGFDAKRCHLLAAGHIARWVSRHPGAITCTELGKALLGWKTGPMFRRCRILGSRMTYEAT
jgi:hypothetical protein